MWNQNPYENNPPPPQQYDTRAYPGANAGGYPGAGGNNYGGYGGPQGGGGGGGGQYGSFAPPPAPPAQYGGYQPQQQQQQQGYNNNGGGYGQGGYNQGGGGGYNNGGYSQGGGGGGAYGGYGGPQGGGGGGYQPPTGAPMPSHYAPTGAGYQPPSQTNMSFNPPPGPPPSRPPTGSQSYGPQFQGQQGAAQQPFFQYSQCNGKRKALLIGINYFGQKGQLRGCINDVHNVQKFLMEKYGYRSEDMVILTDDQKNPRSIPTKANMIQAMQWLVRDARPNDALFFHYSGHGGQTKDLNGDEDDGNDEVVYPVDFKQAGHIVDDQMHEIMVRPLPPGCRLTAIFDSCHSATALDLPYVYSTEGKIKEPNLLAEAGSGVLSAGMSYMKGDVGGALSGLMNIGKSVMGGNSKAYETTKKTKTSPADVVMWSGCKDSQTSADASEAGKATGAMSYAFIAAMTKNPQQSYIQLLRSIRGELANKYSQKPQLSSSHPIDVNLLFIC